MRWEATASRIRNYSAYESEDLPMVRVTARQVTRASEGREAGIKVILFQFSQRFSSFFPF